MFGLFAARTMPAGQAANTQSTNVLLAVLVWEFRWRASAEDLPEEPPKECGIYSAGNDFEETANQL
jgi:hypothetical protein